MYRYTVHFTNKSKATLEAHEAINNHYVDPVDVRFFREMENKDGSCDQIEVARFAWAHIVGYNREPIPTPAEEVATPADLCAPGPEKLVRYVVLPYLDADVLSRFPGLADILASFVRYFYGLACPTIDVAFDLVGPDEPRTAEVVLLVHCPEGPRPTPWKSELSDLERAFDKAIHRALHAVGLA